MLILLPFTYGCAGIVLPSTGTNCIVTTPVTMFTVAFVIV